MKNITMEEYMKKITLPAALLLALFLSSAAFAADDDTYFTGFRAGLTMGVSGYNDFYNDYFDLVEPYSEQWLGLTMNIDDYLMIRTLVTFSFTSMNRSNNLPAGGDYDKPFWRLGGILGVFYQFTVNKNLYCYTGPEMAYIFTSFEDGRDFSTSDYEKNTVNELRLSGLFGCRYMFSRNFGIFADLGLGFMFLDNRSEDFDSTPGTESTQYKTIYVYQAQVGVVFYVN
ncbi:MAG: hypothetical protein CVV44_10725 [Spirochaetae bacterium HGW-Spirochaetae-1]|nr:MAG: hypothetical protein CVV44_10725 [Spirochaetae bacterium HGW-Spirochaetae-1]